MDNPETVATLSTQDTGWRQTKIKKQTKLKQKHNTIQKIKKDELQGPHQRLEVSLGA